MPKLEFSFTVSEENLTRVIRGVAYQNDYQDEIADPDSGKTIPNPESKAQFAKRMVKEYIINCVRAFEAGSAAEEARLEAIQDVDDNVGLT